jgi:hypothetical protein
MVGDALATRLGRLNQNAVAGVSTVEYVAMDGEEDAAAKATHVRN